MGDFHPGQVLYFSRDPDHVMYQTHQMAPAILLLGPASDLDHDMYGPDLWYYYHPKRGTDFLSLNWFELEVRDERLTGWDPVRGCSC